MITHKRRAQLNLISSWYVTKFSRDIYLPSLPAIAIGLSTTDTVVKYSITAYFLGLAISRLLWTPLSDVYGRRNIILCSLPLFILGSFINIITPDVQFFIIGRLLQALGIGCITSLGRASLSDLYEKKETTRAIAYLSFFAAWAPALATIVGGHLQESFGWRSESVVLFVLGIFFFLQSYFVLQETNRDRLEAKAIFKQVTTNFKLLLKNVTYCRYLLCYSLIFSGTVVYYTSSPFLFINAMGISPQIYGYFALFTVAGLLGGKLIATRMTHFYELDTIIVTGVYVALLGGIMLALISFIFPPKLILILPIVLIYFIGSGIMSPTSKAASMSVLAKTAGTASALFGASQGIASVVASLITAHAHQRNAFPMAVTFTILALLALLAHRRMSKQ